MFLCAQQTKVVIKNIDDTGIKQVYSVIDFSDSSEIKDLANKKIYPEIMHGSFQTFYHDTLLAKIVFGKITIYKMARSKVLEPIITVKKMECGHIIPIPAHLFVKSMSSPEKPQFWILFYTMKKKIIEFTKVVMSLPNIEAEIMN